MFRSRTSLIAISAFLLLTIFYYASFVRNRPHTTTTAGSTGAYDSSSPTFSYVPGTVKPVGESYSRTLVVAALESEDVSWIDKSDTSFAKAIYIVDKPSLSPGYQVPTNKGHEAMVYLTYIIEYYDTLSDVNIFVHSHQTSWHNNDLLDSDMLHTLKRLSDAHVTRSGYFNLRCHHEPGCPDWLHLDRPDDQLDTHRKMEEKSFSIDVWHGLHPGVPPPNAISQPCCAQFAVSKERIRAIPKSEYVRYRNWILNTSLEDTYSGRVMEYTWQYLFAGVPELCPAMNVCYCDGYGICFGGAKQLDAWFDDRQKMRNLTGDASKMADRPEKEETVRRYREEAHQIEVKQARLLNEAFERGRDPRLRAQEVGRQWEDGDGF